MSTEVKTVEENQQQIKESILKGDAVGGTIQNNAKINDLHREYMALQSVEGIAKNSLYNFKKEQLNEKVNALSKELNNNFANESTTNNIMEYLQFDSDLKEKLSELEYLTYKKLSESFDFEVVKSTLLNNKFNVYDSIAKLNGYDNFIDYQEAQTKFKQELEKTNSEIEADEKQVALMARAFTIALNNQNKI